MNLYNPSVVTVPIKNELPTETNSNTRHATANRLVQRVCT